MPDLALSLERHLGLSVSRETLERLTIHLELLEKWNPRINLVSRATLPEAWQRHVLDSAQVFQFSPASGGLWLDFGTGGGFPGLVCAILAAELHPDLAYTFVESDGRKAAFLHQVLAATGLRAEIRADRIEAVPPQAARIVSARAVAALPSLLAYAQPHLAPGGTCLFPKGANHDEEIALARQHWRFKLSKKPSITEDKAVILVLGDIERV
ncbi:16S rRNA (guanine(527)-N(7))-methyltransferase RsmG [Tropicimonas sp. IMCC34043]|uniref:16S rRNA (guanine(527)-N(7))-methyltransferase RsmG n=1 Tax=Tropicimonas sp. IMCC34043 TaxID=2248760 RepID=UPI001E58E68A|nr:16S rRNA (guanine(527)-N(7))-methyltransferase RsmG [Tropicimonas sp. IMCC34043]